MGVDDRNSFAVPLLPMRNIKLCHMHMWLILTLNGADEGKRQIFTHEIFVHTSEKNTKGGKYKSQRSVPSEIFVHFPEKHCNKASVHSLLLRGIFHQISMFLLEYKR